MAVEHRPRTRALDVYLATAEVVSQERARKQMAVLLERQAMVASGLLSKSSGAILSGRSGTGKTYLARLACGACGLPYAEVNATQYTDRGYIGLDLAQIFLPLLESAGRLYDAKREAQPYHVEPSLNETGVLRRAPEELVAIIKLAESGVLVVDEFDKWMLNQSDQAGRDVGRKLQAELLKMVEGSVERVSDSEENEYGVAFDTSRVLMICAGAFVNLPRMVLRRLGREEEFMHEEGFWDLIEPTDFVRYGLLPELAGRLATHIFTRPLTADALSQIMLQPGGIVEDYRTRFEVYGHQWQVPEHAISWLASVAIERGTGARGAEHVMWGFFSDALFEAAVNEQAMRVRFEANSHRAWLEQ